MIVTLLSYEAVSRKADAAQRAHVLSNPMTLPAVRPSLYGLLWKYSDALQPQGALPSQGLPI